MELPRPLIDADRLAGLIGEPGLVVADVRWVPGGTADDARRAFAGGHLPGAVFVDVDRDLAAPPGPGGRHPLPDPETFAAAMSRLGIGEDTAVVAVDDAGGTLAARLWWMLDALGQTVSVLDGGSGSWSGALETGAPAPRPPATRSARPWPREAVVDPDEVVRILRAGDAAVVDARAPERYRGEVERIDPIAGHVPGSVSAPWADNLDAGTGRFLPPAELRRRYRTIGAGDGAVATCGSGVTACHDLLAMRVAGLRRTRLFAASWSGWIVDRTRPVATGAEPGGPP